MAQKDFKDLIGRTDAEKVLRDKAFSIGKHPKYEWNKLGLASMVYNFFDRKLQVVLLKKKLCKMKNKIKNYKKWL